MRIKHLTLYSNNLKEQKKFYSEKMQFPIVKSSETEVTFEIGQSILTFIESTNATPYHFAINIPANKEIEAYVWLKEKVEILKDGDNVIQDFDFWNAKAIYFYDADKNIVEFIARKKLKNSSEEIFDSNQCLEISEIGAPSKNIKPIFNFLDQNYQLPIYSGNLERFCAIGDETGLFICVNNEIKNWFPTDEIAYPSEFKAVIEVNNQEFGLEFKNEELFKV